jgi:hypothetical protein
MDLDEAIRQAREMQRNGQYIRVREVFHLMADEIERLRAAAGGEQGGDEASSWLVAARALHSRLVSRSRVETFMPGSIAPELLRRSEEVVSEGIEVVERIAGGERGGE